MISQKCLKMSESHMEREEHEAGKADMEKYGRKWVKKSDILD
jgi:hypothetical protein